MAAPSVEAGTAAVGSGSATATSLTFTIPTGTLVNDTICIYCVAAVSNAWTATNFVGQAIAGSSAPFGTLLTYTYLGTEGWTPGTTTVVANKASTGKAICGVIFSLNGTFDPALSGSGVGGQVSSLNMAIPGITLVNTNANDQVLWLGFNSSAAGATPGTITAPAGFVALTAEIKTSSASLANQGLLIASKVFNVAGATGTLTGTDGTSQLFGGLVMGLAGPFIPAQPIVIRQAVKRASSW